MGFLAGLLLPMLYHRWLDGLPGGLKTPWRPWRSSDGHATVFQEKENSYD
jgi:hypothetical protein